MRIILIGAPGAGKGTQADLITKRYNIAKISTGDMLRQAVADKTKIGLEAKEIMDKGELVSDDIILTMIKERIKKDDCANGYLFDGFPRNVIQAKALQDAGIKIDHVVEIFVADDEIVKRITGRRIHQPSGRTYHVIFNPPRVEGLDDVTSEPLIHRVDDTEQTVRKRLEIYHSSTAPLVEYYKNNPQLANFTKIDGVGEIEAITKEIFKRLDN